MKLVAMVYESLLQCACSEGRDAKFAPDVQSWCFLPAIAANTWWKPLVADDWIEGRKYHHTLKGSSFKSGSQSAKA